MNVCYVFEMVLLAFQRKWYKHAGSWKVMEEHVRRRGKKLRQKSRKGFPIKGI